MASNLRSSKRKITDFFYTNLQAKKRLMKNCAERGQIENIFAKFPILSEEIFGLLDYKTLAICKEVDRNWFETLNNQRIYWIQMIHKSTSENFRKDWMLTVNKVPLESLKKLAELAWKYSHKNESPLLQIVAQHGETDLFKFVVGKIGYKHSKLRHLDDNTPLHIAADKGHLDICKFIIDQVDDKNPQNKKGSTPFHNAALWVDPEEEGNLCRGHFEICQLIFESIGHKNPADNNGITPFHLAALTNLEICQMIIDNVEDKNPASKAGKTPLHLAAGVGGDFETCKLIIDKIEVKNPEANNGSTPLHIAAKEGYFEVFKLIFDKIEIKNPRSEKGITPLHSSANYGHLEICKLICSSIQDKNPVDNRGRIPLDLAIASSVKNKLKEEVVQYEKNLKVIHFLIGEIYLQS